MKKNEKNSKKSPSWLAESLDSQIQTGEKGKKRKIESTFAVSLCWRRFGQSGVSIYTDSADGQDADADTTGQGSEISIQGDS